jgi:hypothetical protein
LARRGSRGIQPAKSDLRGKADMRLESWDVGL